MTLSFKPTKARDLSRIRQAFIFIGRKLCRIPTVGLAQYLKRDPSTISKILQRKEALWGELPELEKLQLALKEAG